MIGIGLCYPLKAVLPSNILTESRCARALQRKWAAFCVEYFTQRTETKVNTNRFAFAALTVNLNFVASQDHATQCEGGCCLAFELGFPVGRNGIAIYQIYAIALAY